MCIVKDSRMYNNIIQNPKYVSLVGLNKPQTPLAWGDLPKITFLVSDNQTTVKLTNDIKSIMDKGLLLCCSKSNK